MMSGLLTALTSSWMRRTARMTSGLILFIYIGSHLLNHALGLISLQAAERGMEYAIEVWYSTPGTILLYGAAAVHFLLALWAVYERRTFWLPPIELIRIALGFTLPLLLIGHAANTRLAYDLFGLASDYTRVVSNLWMTGNQGWQLGLMAPGWLHGCLGLHLAFNRRPWYRKSRYILFSVALLLPVLSALGFIAMGRELAVTPDAVAAAQKYFSPEFAPQRLAIAEWKDQLLNGYFSIIALAFVAREIRNLIERRRKKLIAISYPVRTVRVPRGWSVLEASRSFHLAHASMCGGRARCSTCRVRVTAGNDNIPPPEADEQATLERISAPPDVRLGCQLRPEGDVTVVPLVQTERPIYRQNAPQRVRTERDIVVLFSDFRNRAELATDHLPHDQLYLLTLYAEAISHAIRASGGTVSYIEFDTICALFGTEGRIDVCAQRALQAAGAIESAVADLNKRLGWAKEDGIRITISIHAGRAAVGEIGSSDPPTMMAVGDAIEAANELRREAAERNRPFAISQAVYAAAGIEPMYQDRVSLPSPDTDAGLVAFLSDAAPIPSPQWTLHGEQGPRVRLQRLWGR
jgi:adenylate cyclase